MSSKISTTSIFSLIRSSHPKIFHIRIIWPISDFLREKKKLVSPKVRVVRPTFLWNQRPKMCVRRFSKVKFGHNFRNTRDQRTKHSAIDASRRDDFFGTTFNFYFTSKKSYDLICTKNLTNKGEVNVYFLKNSIFRKIHSLCNWMHNSPTRCYQTSIYGSIYF